MGCHNVTNLDEDDPLRDGLTPVHRMAPGGAAPAGGGQRLAGLADGLADATESGAQKIPGSYGRRAPMR